MSRRSVRAAWIGLSVAALLFFLVPCAAAQTATQGGDTSNEKADFKSPMVLETVFAAADRSLWDPTKGHKLGEWFSTDEYHGLGKFNCDGVYLRSNYNEKKGTWNPGLEMAVTTGAQGQVQVKVRAIADNPKGNKDRKVSILFEAMNGDKVLSSALGTHGVEEGDEKPVTVNFSFAPTDLVADPMTKLRLTVKVVKD
jgi:hypothetical protein